MPIFCLGYAQIRTPLGERATMERWFRTQQSSINHTTQGLGKTSAKEFGKCIRLETLTRKAVSRAQNRLCANSKYKPFSGKFAPRSAPGMERYFC